MDGLVAVHGYTTSTRTPARPHDRCDRSPDMPAAGRPPSPVGTMAHDKDSSRHCWPGNYPVAGILGRVFGELGTPLCQIPKGGSEIRNSQAWAADRNPLVVGLPPTPGARSAPYFTLASMVPPQGPHLASPQAP
ncbi:hypothetical protein GGTG_08116 [Gaeumannomyces tritici R3-111a-1]|uniref:Uncharacterized protein n=1 Tax=Gaeumannomyces tritici (strain R3-111a-1) TaxID=644352 RepID=J3P3M9_GAET3|nr:hypothetical protein GGTG_08116 [Gaeumannomyces tritici R3-111a-1]EJT74273.1 hypothetical protein GGTG_08116 [Gaeumannomyces tritici R3-111a-1]